MDRMRIERRDPLMLAAAVAASGLAFVASPPSPSELASIERPRVIEAANKYLTRSPQTITAFHAASSAGGPHDFFSEGDYWWPDPAHPDGPYIRRDGESNPDNFVDHRRAMMRLSVEMPALTAAWLLSSDSRYAEHARRHLHAWFVDAATRMGPNLQYAQAIHGITTGRGTGIIDTIHLVEVARAIAVLRRTHMLSEKEFGPIRAWFADYTRWMTTSLNGIEEREAKNNHGTCWVMQAAEFARYVDRRDLIDFCRDRFKSVLVPQQIAADGSFPEELRRTKPYGYSLFNLDAMTMICQILSSSSDDLWTWRLPDGRGIALAMAFMFPFIRDKRAWPHKPDVMYFDRWPVRHPSLLFAGLALDRSEYLDVWRRLDPDPTVEEVIRNYFIRQPVLWVG
jgi:hypothetical protein